jgi:hypothetical protein
MVRFLARLIGRHLILLELGKLTKKESTSSQRPASFVELRARYWLSNSERLEHSLTESQNLIDNCCQDDLDLICTRSYKQGWI